MAREEDGEVYDRAYVFSHVRQPSLRVGMGSRAPSPRVPEEDRRGVPPVSARLEGTLVSGRYQIRHVLGVGGSASIYEAEDITFGRAVALKITHENVGASSLAPEGVSPVPLFPCSPVPATESRRVLVGFPRAPTG